MSNMIAAVCAHSVSISIGMCQGYSAILLPQLKDHHEMDIDEEQSSWLASFGAVTNPVGAILSGILAEQFGRRRSIQISSIPFVLGWLLIGFGMDIRWLYAGRLISGIAAGMSAACYTYVSEISSAKHRGLLQSLGPIFGSFGILLTYSLGYAMAWPKVAILSCTFAIGSALAMEWSPESPAYLFQHGQLNASLDAYMQLRRSDNRDCAMREMQQQQYGSTKQVTGGKTWSDIWTSLRKRQTYRPFLLLVGLFMLQELAGIYTLLFYAVDFFHQANLRLDHYVASIIVAALRLFMSLVMAALVHAHDRRHLCMISALGMALTMLTMASYFRYYELNGTVDRMWSFLPMVCVVLNVVFSMVGMMPIPWIMVGEMFPLQVRSWMCGLVICVAQCFIFVAVKMYPTLVRTLGFSGTLYTFGSASLLSFLFAKYVLIETRGMTLQQIEEKLAKRAVAEPIKIAGHINAAFQTDA